MKPNNNGKYAEKFIGAALICAVAALSAFIGYFLLSALLYSLPMPGSKEVTDKAIGMFTVGNFIVVVLLLVGLINRSSSPDSRQSAGGDSGLIAGASHCGDGDGGGDGGGD